MSQEEILSRLLDLPEGDPVKERFLADAIAGTADSEAVEAALAGATVVSHNPQPAAAPAVDPAAAARGLAEAIEAIARGASPPIDEAKVRAIAEAADEAAIERLEARLRAGGATTMGIRIAIAGAKPGASGLTRVERILASAAPASGGIGIATHIASPPGVGKSFGIERYADAAGLELHTYVCDGGVDEVSAMLTTTVPHDAATSGFRALNGPVTEAFLAAGAKADPSKTDPDPEAGQHLLFIDEILRGVYAQNFLIAMLQPVQRDGRRFWRLRSQIEDGHGNLATIYAPVERLHIVAASNLHGSSPDLALWSRLCTHRLPYLRAEASAILQAIGQKYGFEPTTAWLGKVLNLIELSTKAANDGRLAYPADNRLFEQAVILAAGAGTANESGVRTQLVELLPGRVCAWDPTSGETDAAQHSIATALVTEAGL